MPSPDEAAPRAPRTHPGRLTPVDRTRELRPLQRARELKHCLLYWLPVPNFPVPRQEREWLLRFLERLAGTLEKDHQLTQEVFLDAKVILPDLHDAVNRTAMEFMPIMGLTYAPGDRLPKIPTEQDMEPITSGRRKFVINEWVPDYSLWFLSRDGVRQRETFFGHGGLTMGFQKAAASTIPRIEFTPGMRRHEVFRVLDVDRLMGSFQAMASPFQQRSKDLLGEPLRDDPQFAGLRFILPRLRATLFFSTPAAEQQKWFELFEVYVTESPADRGLLIASRPDIEEDLIGIVQTMRDEGLFYQEQAG